MRNLHRLSLVLGLVAQGAAGSFQVPQSSSLSRTRKLLPPALLASSAASRSTDASNGGEAPQIIDLIEPTTGTPVRIIGTMHYNPTSIRQVTQSIDDLASSNLLGSVVVESCEVRWNKTMEILATPRGKWFEPVLTSEMKAASDRAAKAGRPVVLGDQLIDATGKRLGEEFKATLKDLATPLGGGWGRYYRELSSAAEMALPTGPGYLSPLSFFDPRLLIAAPVSFAKYPLSFLARNPLSTAVVLSILAGLTVLDNQSAASFAEAPLQDQISSLAFSFAFAALEFAVLGRIMVRVLLAERNEVIARSILDQCRIYSGPGTKSSAEGKKDSPPGNFFTKLLALLSPEPAAREGDDGAYLPGSALSAALSDTDDDREGKYVVAVLGMAHANGIVKLLKEQLV